MIIDIKVKWIPMGIAGFIMGEIVLNYVLSVYLGHQEGYPPAYITSSANHYPEFVFFRTVMEVMIGASLILRIIRYFWFRYNLKKAAHLPPIIIQLLIGCSANLCLMAGVATIDTGNMNMHLHQHFTGAYFILTIVQCIIDVSLCYVIYNQKQKRIKLWNLSIKAMLLVGIIVGSLNSKGSHTQKVLIQYLITFLSALYTFSMGYDFNNYSLDFIIK